MDAPHRREQQRRGVLRDRIGRVRGNMHHVDLAVRLRNVHVIVARAAKRDQTNAVLVQLVDHRGTHGIIDENAHRVKPLREVGRVLRQLRLKKLERNLRITLRHLRKGLDIVFLSIEKCNFDHFTTPPIILNKEPEPPSL